MRFKWFLLYEFSDYWMTIADDSVGVNLTNNTYLTIDIVQVSATSQDNHKFVLFADFIDFKMKYYNIPKGSLADLGPCMMYFQPCRLVWLQKEWKFSTISLLYSSGILPRM